MNAPRMVGLLALCMLALAACPAGDDDDGGLRVTGQAGSDCGGYESMGQRIYETPAGYCDAERLHWNYDATTNTLHVVDARVMLNCCGVRDLDGELVGGELVLTLTDGPESAGRCGCMCVFDVEATIENLPATGGLEAQLVHQVSDSNDGPRTVWTGSLDLSGTPAGFAVVDASSAEPWCEEPVGP